MHGIKFTDLASSLSDEATQRNVVAFVTATIASWAVLSVVYACVAYVLWAWLAFVIAALAAIVTGKHVAAYMQGSGYDHAVNAVASVRGFFARRSEVAA